MQRALELVTSSREILHRNRFGALLSLRPDNYIDNVVLRDSYYESEVLEALRAQLPQGAVIWDVGANFGLHAVTLKALRRDARVICLEPQLSQAARIIKNAALNDVTLEVLPLGLGARREFLPLHVVDGNPGMSTFVPWEKAHYSATALCMVEPGDQLVAQGIPAPDCIKLDIEGGESAALEGLREVLQQRRPKLIFEGGEELAGEVRKIGFSRVVLLNRNEATEHALQNYCATWD